MDPLNDILTNVARYLLKTFRFAIRRLVSFLLSHFKIRNIPSLPPIAHASREEDFNTAVAELDDLRADETRIKEQKGLFIAEAVLADALKDLDVAETAVLAAKEVVPMPRRALPMPRAGSRGQCLPISSTTLSAPVTMQV